MSDQDYVHNKREQTDSNDQRKNKTGGGEYRNGRLSQIKNHNPNDDQSTPNEFLSQQE